jgi:hypothetical protein
MNITYLLFYCVLLQAGTVQIRILKSDTGDEGLQYLFINYAVV